LCRIDPDRIERKPHRSSVGSLVVVAQRYRTGAPEDDGANSEDRDNEESEDFKCRRPVDAPAAIFNGAHGLRPPQPPKHTKAAAIPTHRSSLLAQEAGR
jgi:hypothetical protein